MGGRWSRFLRLLFCAAARRFLFVYHMCSGSGGQEQQQKSRRQRVSKTEREGRELVVENVDAKG